MPVCNFFLMALREGSEGTHKKFTARCSVQHGELKSIWDDKTVENHFYEGGVFFGSTAAWPQYAGLHFFSHGSREVVPRNAQKVYRGLRGPAW